jgi:hypothetical protein
VRFLNSFAVKSFRAFGLAGLENFGGGLEVIVAAVSHVKCTEPFCPAKAECGLSSKLVDAV